MNTPAIDWTKTRATFVVATVNKHTGALVQVLAYQIKHEAAIKDRDTWARYPIMPEHEVHNIERPKN